MVAGACCGRERAVKVAREKMERRECCCWSHDQRRKKPRASETEGCSPEKRLFAGNLLGCGARVSSECVCANGESERD